MTASFTDCGTMGGTSRRTIDGFALPREDIFRSKDAMKKAPTESGRLFVWDWTP